MPPNDLITELRTGEREQMSEEELERITSKLEEEANQQGMKVLQIDKPIIGKRTMIGKAFDECFKEFPLLRELGKKK